MLTTFLQSNKFLRKLVYKGGDKRARKMVKIIEPFLTKKDKILDLGTGTCNVDEVLCNKGYDVTLLDVKDISFVDNLKPMIFDGEKIPFDDNHFDVVLILTVLHHVPDPDKLLKEAKRVSKKVVIIEDIYYNSFQKYRTYFLDSLFNLEFFGHPHSNKDDKGWKKTFKKEGLRLVDSKYGKFFLFMFTATYFLEKSKVN